MATILRDPEPGDFGWVIHRHGALYGAEHGYDTQFEALVSEVVAKFIREFNPALDRCWIAEIDGQKAGSIFLVHTEDGIAKLRLLLVEPFARGQGVGKMLVEECIAFAREADYAKVVLWTESELAAARSIYERAGFKLIASEPHTMFGLPQVGETWELVLR
jgi:GNAT superfamily N-acetyltransferase